jgi:transmembrane sensor
MSSPTEHSPLPAATRAEAAAWVARLHGPHRTPEVEAGLKRWLAEDSERRRAFELITETWERSARLRRRGFEHVPISARATGIRLSISRAALATGAIALIAVFSTALYFRTDGLSTGVGEQRIVTLEDGSHITLNTRTQVRVHYDRDARRIELKHGEAFFEVAKHPDWPFIVNAGGEDVRALGTVFMVREDADRLSVTLIEGRVTVSPTQGRVSAPQVPSGLSSAAHPSPVDDSTARPSQGVATSAAADGGMITLKPGERLLLRPDHSPQFDRPALESVTAWQRGRIALDSTLLSDAVSEMNRYSPIRIVIADARVAAIPISGEFRAGDSEDFARAVARAFHLALRHDGGSIVLSSAASH